ncbi:DJ-1/PfpI family protein [Kibdelosporangium lantanae]
MARVLILAGDAAEELDSMYPVFRLRESGHEAIVAAPTTRPVKLVVHDFEPGWDAYTEKPGHHLPVDLAFADVRPEDYDGLVIPGGRAPEYIRTDPDVARVVRYFFEQDLPVGTICHGPQVPAALGLLRGRVTAAYPPLRADVEHAGATYVDGPDVVDGAMVSCRGWPDLPEWSRAFMRLLEKSVA